MKKMVVKIIHHAVKHNKRSNAHFPSLSHPPSEPQKRMMSNLLQNLNTKIRRRVDGDKTLRPQFSK